jgi:hypothetical protein
VTANIAALYELAWSALAAYAVGAPELEAQAYIDRLIQNGMCAAQAVKFVAEYRVVEQYDGTVAHTNVDDFGVEQRATLETGLSVTLFESTADGH